ncbi:hypothetical protein ACIBG0_38360 [Nocardia sp. NPDC050630]|uniref:WXG100-like domain-containing protein n=1 Tax=Nocardia sp. NPDC050630 TaxID=3364321 RepID=UPI0037B53ECD
MAIEIPHEVALFLNIVGVPYPDINEDHVRELAHHVRTFASAVADTYESATTTIKDMNSVYSGYSYEQLVAAWGRMSVTHMSALDRACGMVAFALDAAAEIIEIVKVAVLAELAALAASYATLIATSIATGGITAALEAAISAAARKLCDALEQTLMSYFLSEVVGKAIEPFERTIDDMIHGVAYDIVSHALGVPSSADSAILPLHIEPDEVRRHAEILQTYADDVLQHATAFADKVSLLDFATSSATWAEDDNAGGATSKNTLVEAHAMQRSFDTFSDSDWRTEAPADRTAAPFTPAATRADASDRFPQHSLDHERPSAETAAGKASSHGSIGQLANSLGTAHTHTPTATGEHSFSPNVPAHATASRITDTEEHPTTGAHPDDSKRQPATLSFDNSGHTAGPHPPATATDDGRHPEPRNNTIDTYHHEFSSDPMRLLPSPETYSVQQESKQLDPAERGSASPAQQQNTGNPWSRSQRQRSQNTKAPKTTPTKTDRIGTPVRKPTDRPLTTPWTNTPTQPDVPAEVFAPNTMQPLPRRLKENTSTRPERSKQRDDNDAKSLAPGSVPPPGDGTVFAPRADLPDQHHRPL